MFEINTMLYLAQLLSIYDGNTTSKWGYFFTKNKFGAPISMEIVQEIKMLSSKNFLLKDDSGYYRISETMPKNLIIKLEGSHVFEWKTKYIMATIDSLLTKPFPKIINAVQYEPGISLLDKINRTSILHGEYSSNLLFDDFKAIKEVVNDPEVNLVIPASLWIDYLALQATSEG